MFTVYILYSDKHKKMYIGYTSNLEQRFLSHNGVANKGWTIKYRPWRIIYTEEYENKKAAMDREKFLKSGIGRDWIKRNQIVN